MKKPAILTASALLCCFLWGSAFPFIKIGYKLLNISANDTPSQILFAGIRFFIAGIIVILLGSFLQKKSLIPKHLITARKIAILSVFQTILQYFFFYVGLAHTQGSKASIIEALNIFFTVIVTTLLFKMEKLTARKVAGCIVGFIGVVIINFTSDGFMTSFSLKGEGALIVSIIAYAFSSVYIKKFSENDNPVLLSGWQFILGGIILALIGATGGGNIDLNSAKGIGLIVYLALVSAIAYTLWGVLLKYNNVSKVSIFGSTTPVFGVILSTIFLHETTFLSTKCLISLILVCAGIIIVNTDSFKASR